VDAKVPPKRNDDRIEDENAHFYAARVQYAMEFASKFEKNVYHCHVITRIRYI